MRKLLKISYLVIIHMHYPTFFSVQVQITDIKKVKTRKERIRKHSEDQICARYKKCKSKPIPTEFVCCEDFRRISLYQNRRKFLSNILIHAKKDWIRNTGCWFLIYFFRMLTFLSFFTLNKCALPGPLHI